jgi:hypothetical protein
VRQRPIAQDGSLLDAEPRMLLDECAALRVEDVSHLHGRPGDGVLGGLRFTRDRGEDRGVGTCTCRCIRPNWPPDPPSRGALDALTDDSAARPRCASSRACSMRKPRPSSRSIRACARRARPKVCSLCRPCHRFASEATLTEFIPSRRGERRQAPTTDAQTEIRCTAVTGRVCRFGADRLFSNHRPQERVVYTPMLTKSALTAREKRHAATD